MIFARILCRLEFKVNQRLLINIYLLANCIIEYLQIVYANIFRIEILIASTITKKVMVSKYSTILLFSWIFSICITTKSNNVKYT